MPSNWENSEVATELENVNCLIPKKGNAKECLNYSARVLIWHTGKFMIGILQARPQQNMNWELPDIQTGFRKSRGIRDWIVDIHWIIRKQRNFRKKIYFFFINYVKAFDCITTKCRTFLKRWEYQTTLPVSWEMWVEVKKQQLEPDREPQAVSKLENDTSRLYIVSLLI